MLYYNISDKQLKTFCKVWIHTHGKRLLTENSQVTNVRSLRSRIVAGLRNVCTSFSRNQEHGIKELN